MTISTKTTPLICLGFILLIFLVHGGECRRGGSVRGGSSSGRYRSGRYSGSYSGTGGGGLGRTGGIILGSILGGLFLLGIVMFVLWWKGVFKTCCKTKQSNTSKTTAYMYSSNPGADGKKIHKVNVTKGSREFPMYSPNYSDYSSAYPPPPPPAYSTAIKSPGMESQGKPIVH